MVINIILVLVYMNQVSFDIIGADCYHAHHSLPLYDRAMTLMMMMMTLNANDDDDANSEYTCDEKVCGCLWDIGHFMFSTSTFWLSGEPFFLMVNDHSKMMMMVIIMVTTLMMTTLMTAGNARSFLTSQYFLLSSFLSLPNKMPMMMMMMVMMVITMGMMFINAFNLPSNKTIWGLYISTSISKTCNL